MNREAIAGEIVHPAHVVPDGVHEVLHNAESSHRAHVHQQGGERVDGSPLEPAVLLLLLPLARLIADQPPNEPQSPARQFAIQPTSLTISQTVRPRGGIQSVKSRQARSQTCPTHCSMTTSTP